MGRTGTNLNKLSHCILAFCLFLSLTAYAGDFQFRYIHSEDDLPEEICSHWKKGDLLVTDGDFLLLVGGTSRMLKSAMAYYPTTSAKGNIISFVPFGKDIHSDLGIGAPRINIKGKSENLSYDTMKAIQDNNSDDSFFCQA